MTVSTNPRLITLSDLRHSFGLMLDENNPFFTQWLNHFLPLDEGEHQGLDMVTNGREVVFVHLDRGQSLPTYSRSSTYHLIENNLERTQVLQGLKYLSRRFSEEGPME